MNLSAPFIRRPVGTTLITVGMALAGVLAFFLLPVRRCRRSTFPTISVSAPAARRQPGDHGLAAWPRRWSGTWAPSPTSPR